jgi:hypothetical protein
MKAALRNPALLTLMAIGFVDLIATAILHSKGLIIELNPLMRPLIERSEWHFAIAKGATLVAAFVVIASYLRTNPEFVRKACWTGSIAYLVIWTLWFVAASI